ncbi:UvrD-helicase domain-containing protein [Ochrovirga pacifica]|uniref:UvrD-helicase domain-containing protein n=1 Tax=Ochrovirga pacifica TaxID=1042376 RepID=UPI0002558357|nr:UvrD-helicase domain-containing protein [Ochrovirga pacifica]
MNSESFFKVYNASAGSGKTYTLVKEYLKVALLRGEFEFQKILAITFTNKAAGEMKERVLNTLKQASRNKENLIISDIAKEAKIPVAEIQEKSKKVLTAILQNYASFHIITIDSFTHKLIRTFSLDLGLPLDFEVEMDVDPMLKETIDLLVSRIGEDKELTEVLVSYALHQVNDDKSWNITNALVDVAKLLLNEENELEVSKLINTSLSDFKELEKRLRNYLGEIEEAFKSVGSQALDLIAMHNIDPKSFSGGDLPNYFKKFLGSCLEKEEWPLGTRLKANMEKGVLYAKSRTPEEKAAIDAIQDEIFRLFNMSLELCHQQFGQYLLVKKILKTLVPLTVLSYIHKEFTHYKEDNNIRLNAEFNQIISKQIRNEPVPFIYERLGERFQYFFIDEMQDTSELQWENLIPLIHNALSQNTGGLMLVGDAKQSIYRWRGGKASQFVHLSDSQATNQFFVEKEVVTLGTNYRSYSHVVDFNNEFFSFVAQYLQNPAYKEIYLAEKNQQKNSKEGGYVRVELFERDEDFEMYEFYGAKIYNQILEIEKNGFQKGDICVLTRKKKDGVAIADYLTSKGVEIISPDSLMLKNNQTVQFLVYLLRWIENSEDKEVLIEVLTYLHKHLNVSKEKHDFFAMGLNLALEEKELFNYLQISFSREIFFSLSLYDGLEYIIRSFMLTNMVDVFVQTFLDQVLKFQTKEAETLQQFFEFWDLKKDKLKVELATSDNAVQIMTIHKSKGLEFPVVLFPFDLNTEDIVREQIWYKTENTAIFGDFESFRINASKKLEYYGETGVNELEKVSQNIQLDNFNLLYVALTRAEEQLYVFSDFKKSKTRTLKNYSDFFREFIESKGSDLFFELGDSGRKSKKEEEELSLVLEHYESVDKSENNIKIVENYNKEDLSRTFGTTIHKAFERITTHDDLALAFSYLETQIVDNELRDRAKNILKSVVYHPLLEKFYQKDLEVFNEQAFLSEKGEMLVLDRLILKNDKAIIIDYKTGKVEEKHKDQIKNYATLLVKMGYKVAETKIVYCNDEIQIVTL